MTDTMKAGPELDALIAEEVMEPMPDGCPISGLGGPVVSEGGWWVWNGMGWMPNKHPTTDIAAAWEVLEKLKTMGHKPIVAWDGVAWKCNVCISWVSAETGPLSICLAARKAVQTRNKEEMINDA